MIAAAWMGALSIHAAGAVHVLLVAPMFAVVSPGGFALVVLLTST